MGRLVRLAVAGSVALISLAGCAAPVAPEATLPPGTRVEVVQNRTDYAAGRMQLRVVNESASDLVVQKVTYADDRFVADAVWAGDSTIRPGVTRDLPVTIPTASCPPSASGGAGRAQLVFAVGEADGSETVEVTDPLEMVERVTAEQCAAAAVDDAAEIDLGASLEFRGSGADEVALVPLTVAATGDAAVVVESLASTVLLQPEDGTDAWLLGQQVDAGST